MFNKSLPPYSVAAGVPAKVIRRRGERLSNAHDIVYGGDVSISG